MKLSLEQQKIFDSINTWTNNSTIPYLTMGGYAGTGKTTIIQEFCKERYELNIHVCALTGKAALNVGSKLSKYCSVSTIHKLLYTPIIDDDGGLVGWDKNNLSESTLDLIIVDEASMVNEEIFIDLLNTKIPVLFVGDHGQLPPINKNSSSNDERVKLHKDHSGFNLMLNPELRLETIHRQALDSPIIRISMLARTGDYIKEGVHGDGVMKVKSVEDVRHLLKEDSDQIMLTDLNRRRVKLNQAGLKYAGLDQKVPTEDARVVCLRNNFKINPPIYNGITGFLVKVEDFDDNRYRVQIVLNEYRGEPPYRGLISKHAFGKEKYYPQEGLSYKDTGDLWDFGYCLTVHKAQGSEFDRVFIFGTGWGAWRNQWMYTAITRAKKELYICMDKV